MNIKNSTLLLLELSEQAEPLKAELDSRVKEVALIYSHAEALKWDVRDYPSSINNFDSDWNIVDGNVTISWSDSWNYGGHAEGNVSFPAQYIYDDEALSTFVSDCQAIKVERDNLKVAQQRLDKVNQLNRLKSELGV